MLLAHRKLEAAMTGISMDDDLPINKSSDFLYDSKSYNTFLFIKQKKMDIYFSVILYPLLITFTKSISVIIAEI